MDIIYLTPNIISLDDKYSGINSKILGQVKSFNRAGFDAYPVSNGCDLKKTKSGFFVYKIANYFSKNIKILRCDTVGYREFLKKLGEIPPSAIYIRFSYFSRAFIRFLRVVRRDYPLCKILLEIPTYPYDKERPMRFWSTWEDKLYRQPLLGLVDRIVTVSDDQKIFGVPTIQITNGIEVASIPVSKVPDYDGSVLNLIGVANVAFWTGFDRLVKALAIFNSSESPTFNIKFKIVGSGACIRELENLTRKYSIDHLVEFTGPLYGEMLNKAFAESHIAIGCLGLHRKNMTHATSLKNREYCARAIPFVFSEIDNAFPEGSPFVHRVSADETPLDIGAIKCFYEDLRSEVPNYPTLMRQYAEETLDWSVVMKPVFDYLQTAA